MKFILFFLCVNIALADQVKVIKKGDPAPFDGVLFTKELEKEIRNNLSIADDRIKLLNKINDLNNKEIEILSNRLELYQKKSLELSDINSKIENTTFIKNAGYFLAGAVITGFIGYGVVQAYR
jgi:hypothetical protein